MLFNVTRWVVGWPPFPVQCSWWSILMTWHPDHRWDYTLIDRRGCVALDGCQPRINLNSHVVLLLLLWSLDFLKHTHHTVPKAVECTSKRSEGGVVYARRSRVCAKVKLLQGCFCTAAITGRRRGRGGSGWPTYHCNCTRPEYYSVLRHICMQRKAQVYMSRCGHPLTISYHITSTTDDVQ